MLFLLPQNLIVDTSRISTSDIHTPFTYEQYSDRIKFLSDVSQNNPTTVRGLPEVVNMSLEYWYTQAVLGWTPNSIDFESNRFYQQTVDSNITPPNYSKFNLLVEICPSSFVSYKSQVYKSPTPELIPINDWGPIKRNIDYPTTTKGTIASFTDLYDTFLLSIYAQYYKFKIQSDKIPEQINTGDICNVYIPYSDLVVHEVNIQARTPVRGITVMDEPNTDIVISTNKSTTLDPVNLDSLLGSVNDVKTLLQTSYLSNSTGSVELSNIDYSKLDNFVFYGSSKDMLANFKYKIQQIEDYEATLRALNLTDTGSTAVSNNIITTQNNIKNVKGSLTGYESYLYYQSSSYTSSSYGEFLPASPKATSTKPYTLYHTTSSLFSNWYSSMYDSSSLFDKQNIYSLYYTIPSKIVEDERNEWFTRFISLVGEEYDTVKLYIKSMTSRFKTVDGIDNDGVQKGLIVDYLKSYGFDASIDFENEELWSYVLGSDASGSYTFTSSSTSHPDTTLVSAVSESVPMRDYTYTVLKRIYNNLPYL